MFGLVYHKIVPILKRIHERRILGRSYKFMVNRTKDKILRLQDQSDYVLSSEEKGQIYKLYHPYVKNKKELETVTVFHEFYTKSTGIFSPLYMPDAFHYIYVDRYFNNWGKAYVIDNKTQYPVIFKNLPQPKLILYRQVDFGMMKIDISCP